MKINETVGALEEKTSLSRIVKEWGNHLESGGVLRAELIKNSKHHNGKDMIVLSEDRPNDINVFFLEISEEGIFPYIVDDGAS